MACGDGRLTLCSVKLPPGLLSQLPKLWWLDIRGGSASDLEIVRGASNLQYLALNQIRGLTDLSVLGELTCLRYISLYGLSKLTQLPSFSALVNLEHADIGQMIRLLSLHELLQAPRLRELVLVKKINVSATDVDEIINHPTIKQFNWFAEDVPEKIWAPIVEKIGLPPVRSMHAGEWFGLPEFAGASVGP